MYTHEIIPSLQKKLSKLARRDKVMDEQVLSKITEVVHCSDVEHYKNLRYSLKDEKRVHIGNFVLVFTFIPAQNKIIFLDFDHHDNIYKR